MGLSWEIDRENSVRGYPLTLSLAVICDLWFKVLTPTATVETFLHFSRKPHECSTLLKICAIVFHIKSLEIFHVKEILSIDWA